MNYSSTRRHILFQLLPLLFIMIVIVIGATNVTQIRQFLTEALGQPANIVINTQITLGPMQYPWHNLAQGGEDKNWRLAPLSGQVRALSPEYIRLDHIYDFYDIVHKDGNSIRLDFSKFDPILADIQATGATPFISLSYTPPELAVNGDITAPPANWKDWEFVVQRTIEHISGTLHIPNVYYEVWNEPDLFGGYKTYGDRNYLTMYQYAAQGAKNAQGTQAFKIGGPAITALYKNWVDSVIQLSINQNLPLDFFSWHRYDPNVETFRSDIGQVRQWLAQYPTKSNLELDITEWGHNSNNDSGYDGQFGAIHTIAVSTELVGNIDKAFIFEIQDGKDPNGQVRWGRWGLFDYSGAAKPRYSALRFLDRLTGDRVQLLGRGSFVKGVSTKDGTDVLTILVNFDPADKHIETVPVTWNGIQPGTYQLDQQLFGGAIRSENISTTSASLHVEIPMSANSAVFLKLHPSL